MERNVQITTSSFVSGEEVAPGKFGKACLWQDQYADVSQEAQKG